MGLKPTVWYSGLKVRAVRRYGNRSIIELYFLEHCSYQALLLAVLTLVILLADRRQKNGNPKHRKYKLVPQTGNDPVSNPYQGIILPLNY